MRSSAERFAGTRGTRESPCLGDRLTLGSQMIVRDERDIVMQLILVVPHLYDGHHRVFVFEHGFVDVLARNGDGFLEVLDNFRVLGFRAKSAVR